MRVRDRISELAGAPSAWLALAAVLLASAAGLMAAAGLAAPGEQTEVRAPRPDSASTDPALPWFGFNELRWANAWQADPGPDPQAPMRASIAATVTAGANANRLPVPWGDLINASGGWDEESWARYRAVYEQMVASGIRPVIVLYSAPRGIDGLTPDWSPPGCNGGLASPPSSEHDADWQAYVVRASNEFDRALGLQVWNEPNSPDYWGGPGCAPDPVRYVELVALARQALDAPGSEHPGRRLVTAGMNPATAAGSIDWRQYVRTTIRAGVLSDADAVGLHLYPRSRSCERGPDPAAAVAGDVVEQLEIAAALVAEPVPLWVTELGFSSAAGQTTDCRALSEIDQGRAIGAAYDAVAGSARVELAIVHQLVDERASPTDALQNTFGVMRDHPRFLEPKLAYLCLAARRGVTEAPAGCG